MSSVSINKNNLAIRHVKNAIKGYRNIIAKIEAKNQNDLADELISMLNDNISLIQGLESKINGINSSIRWNARQQEGDNSG